MTTQKTQETTIFYTAVLLVFVCPFVYIKGLYNFATLPQSSLIEISAVLLVIAFLFNRYFSPEPVSFLRHPLNTAVVCFAGWTLASSLYALNRFEAMEQWRHWAACVLLFFLFQQLLTSKDRALKLLAALYVAGVLSALIGICQHLFLIDFIPQSVPPAATFANKNMAAQFITLTFPTGVALLLWSKEKSTTWAAALASSLMIVFLAYTRTRAGWVSVLSEMTLMTALFFFPGVRKKRLSWNRDKTLAILAGGALILIMINVTSHGFQLQFRSVMNRAASIGDYLPSRPAEDGETAEKVGKKQPPVRLAIWKNTIEMIHKKPIVGYGLGNHKVYYPKFHATIVKEQQFSENRQLTNVHNDFLQLFAETGIIGIAITSAVLLIFFRLALSTLPGSQDTVFFMVMAAAAATAGIIVNSCFSFPFEMPIPPLAVACYFSIVLCVSNQDRGKCFQIRGKWKIVLAVVLVPVLFHLMRYAYLDIQCDRYYRETKNLEKQQRWKAVTVVANRAYTLNPDRKKILSYAARGYIETGQYRKGIDALNPVIQAYPWHMNALLNLGAAHGGLKEYDKAMGYYEKALEIKPDFSKAHINMAGIFMNRKEYQKAVSSFKQAAANDPNNPMVLYNMGLSQFYLKAYEQAAATLEKTVGIEPDMVNAQLNLAILYYQYLNRPEQSIPHFKKALTLNPEMDNHEEIKRILQVFSRKNQKDKTL